MFATLLASILLNAAPTSFEDGEFLGWTQDGNEFAWVTMIDFKQDEDPRTAKLATVRNVLTAHEETYELERLPLGGSGTPKVLPGAAAFEAWKQSHPLVRLSTLAGVEAGARIAGKDSKSWGGNGKAVAPELFTSRLGVKHAGKSALAEYQGKAVQATKASWWFDPTGRRVLFELAMTAKKGERATTELVEVFAGPTAFLYAADSTGFEAQRAQVEGAGFAVQGCDEASKKRAGLVVSSSAANTSAAETLAKALGGTAEKRAVRKDLGELLVAFGVVAP